MKAIYIILLFATCALLTACSSKPNQTQAQQTAQAALDEKGVYSKIVYRSLPTAVPREINCFQRRRLLERGSVVRRGSSLHQDFTITATGKAEGISTPGENEVSISWGKAVVDSVVEIGDVKKPSNHVDIVVKWKYQRTISRDLYKECFEDLGNDLTDEQSAVHDATVTVKKENGEWRVISTVVSN